MSSLVIIITISRRWDRLRLQLRFRRLPAALGRTVHDFRTRLKYDRLVLGFGGLSSPDHNAIFTMTPVVSGTLPLWALIWI